MYQLGKITKGDGEGLQTLWKRGPPREFVERVYGRSDASDWVCDGCALTKPDSRRFRCVECKDVDFCPSCHDRVAEKHPEHEFVELDESTPVQDTSHYLISYQSTHTAQAYAYKPLNASKQEVRLVALLPALKAEEIQCRIAHAPLYARLQFEALSYTWGSMNSPASIQVDGAAFPVGQNLFSALRSLRLPDKPRYLWIDAICINQSDDEEKSREVQRMRKIYQHASDVIVWLGEAADGSDGAMELAASQTLGNVLYGTDAHWAALERLIRRPWWNRVWCLQELVSSRWSPNMTCGDKSVTWMQMNDTCRKLPLYWERNGRSAGESYTVSNQGLTFQRFASIRSQYTSGIQLRLLYLLYMTLAWEATDPRDKVFALLGLCDQEDRQALAPDYTLSLRQVYEQTAMHLIKRDLNLFCLNTNSDRKDASGYLPSWVPDWSLGVTRPPPLWVAGCYAASNHSTDKRTKPAILESEDRDVIRVAGTFLDFVGDVTEIITIQDTWTDNEPTELYDLIRRIESFVRRCMAPKAPQADPDMFSDPKRCDTLWRTLIADKEYPQFSWSSPASPAFAMVYAVLQARAWGRDLDVDITSEKSEDKGTADSATETEPDESSAEDLDRYIRRYASLVKHTLHSRRLFITKKGFFGVASQDIQEGDVVCILTGGDMPFVLRERSKTNDDGLPKGSESTMGTQPSTNAGDEKPREDGKGGSPLRLISEAYVYGAMDGKLFKERELVVFPIR